MPNVEERNPIEKMIHQNCTIIQHMCEKIIKTWGKKWKWRSHVGLVPQGSINTCFLVFKKKESEVLTFTKLWITQLKRNQDSSPRIKVLHYPKIAGRSIYFINEQLRKGYILHQNHHKHHQYFMFQKKDMTKEWWHRLLFLNDWNIKN